MLDNCKNFQYNYFMKLKEINNLIKSYKRTMAACKKNNLNKIVEYYRVKIQSARTERKEILKKKENA